MFIKFTKDTDDDRIPFLDLLVIKTAEGNIEIGIFYKKQTHINISVLKVHIQEKSKETSQSHSHKAADNKSQIQIAKNNALRN